MSADNGIYILETPIGSNKSIQEFRVVHAQAIENINWNSEKSNFDHEYWNKEALIDYFGECKVYKSQLEALEAASEMAKDYTMLEYGISSIECPIPFPNVSCRDAC